jgi:hypothetical protein
MGDSLLRLAGAATVVLSALVGILGCGGGARRQAQELSQSNLRPLGILYGQYISQHRGQAPKNETEFRAFIKSLKPAQLAAVAGSRDADSLFVSTRDQKPYVVIYGKAQGPPGPAGSPVVAYEQEGRGGKRFVGNSLGAVEELDEATFKQRVPGAK